MKCKHERGVDVRVWRFPTMLYYAIVSPTYLTKRMLFADVTSGLKRGRSRISHVDWNWKHISWELFHPFSAASRFESLWNREINGRNYQMGEQREAGRIKKKWVDYRKNQECWQVCRPEPNRAFLGTWKTAVHQCWMSLNNSAQLKIYQLSPSRPR